MFAGIIEKKSKVLSNEHIGGAVEGVSLTINSINKHKIKLMLVPNMLLNTPLNTLKSGQLVNIEFHYLTRIVAHQLGIAGKI